MRPFADAHRGMSRESFPELPQMPERWREIPVGVLASMIAQDHLRHLDGRIALHAERRAAAAAKTA